jgi:hypothetical protein
MLFILIILLVYNYISGMPTRTRYIIKINIRDLYLLATLELKGERQ